VRIQASWRRRHSDRGLRQRQLSRPQSTELSRRGGSTAKLRGSRPGSGNSGSKLRGTGNRSRELAAAPAAAEPSPFKKGAAKPFVHVVSDDISVL
jgi:hypothetical protein